MNEFKLEKRKISDLIADINKGDIQLPQFQRDYKWKPAAVMKLIDSLNKLHPAGSLLFLEIDTSKEPFIAYEKVRTAPDAASNTKPQYLILDGQQRLTSCHTAFTNSGHKKTYFIDLNILMEKYKNNRGSLDLIDEKILIVKNFITQPDQLLFSHNLLPFSYLLKKDDPTRSKEEFRKKLYNFKENLRIENENKDLLKFVETELENFLDSFYDYEFPTVILPKTLDIAGVCKVFQTINTTGLKLSAFDICVATFMPHKINIKEKLILAKSNKPNINALLEDDETIILQTIALIAGVWPKKNNLPDNLKAHHIVAQWDKAVEYLNVCVDILDKIGLGVSRGTDLMPYQPIIPVIAASLANINYSGFTHPQKSSAEIKIAKWFYTVCLNLRYTEGTDNKMKEDYEKLVIWISGNQEPDYIKNAILWNPKKIITANKNGAFGKTIMVALNSHQLKDFYTPDNVGYNENCQQHHIFPVAKYKNNANINSVFNFTFITTKSNQYIKDKKTNEYIPGIIQETGISELALTEKLGNHFIDERCYGNLQSENIDEFLINRVDNLYNFFKNNIGVNLSIASQQSEDIDADIDENFDTPEPEDE